MEWIMTLERFGSSIGIEQLSPDVDGSCSLLFDSQHEITFTHDEEDHSLLMYCEIDNASGLSKEACLTLLKASLLGAETGGAAISLNTPLEQIVLWKRYDDNMLNADTMGIAVNDFLAQVTVWKRRITELPKEYDTTTSLGESSATMKNFNMFV